MVKPGAPFSISTEPMPSRPGPDQEHLSLGTVGSEDFGAIDAKAFAIGCRGGLQVRHSRAGFGLGHSKGNHRLAAQDRAEISCLLFPCGEFSEGADGAEVPGLDRIGAAGAYFRYRLDGQDGVQQRAAHAAIFLRQGNAHQPHRSHPAGHIPGIGRVAGPRRRACGQFVRRKAPHGLLEQMLFAAKGEVHFQSLGSRLA